LSELFYAVLCKTVMHNDTRMSSFTVESFYVQV